MREFIGPGATVGIIGGGVLAYQMAATANAMGMKTVILAPSQTDIALEKADVPLVGASNDRRALATLADQSTVITFTDENVDASVLESLHTEAKLPSGLDILSVTQDRYLEKVFLDDLNMNILPYTQVLSAKDIRDAFGVIGLPAILKPIQKGIGSNQQLLLTQIGDAERAGKLLQQRPYILEAFLTEIQEFAVVVAKADETVQIGPVIQNYFQAHQLQASVVKADVPRSVEKEIQRIAGKIADKLDYTGVFGLEFFLTPRGGLYVKRLFPGPKMYSHVLSLTSNTSAYDLHLRALLGWPLPTIHLHTDGISIPLHEADMPAVLTQIQIKPDWHFTFYPLGSAFAGEMQVVGTMPTILKNINATGHFVIPTDEQKRS